MEVYNYPVPFCLVKNFLNYEEIERVKSELATLKPELKGPESTGSAKDDNNNLSVKRKGLFLQDYTYLKGNSGINRIYDKVTDPYFKEKLCSKNWVFEYFNNSFSWNSTLISLYGEGDSYKYHKDSSVLSIIYYLFDGEFGGGDFLLQHVKVPIQNNSLIIFPSCFHHAVTPVTGSGQRWSITNFYNIGQPIKLQEDNIIRFRNFTSPKEWKYIQDVLKNAPWTLDGISDPLDPLASKFWFTDLSKHEFFNKELFERIPNGPWKLERVYANGHSFGQNGEFHQDSKNDKNWTFLLYANEIDEKLINKWGGCTEFETRGGRISQVPEPNLGVLFQSTIYHRGFSPSRYVNALRTTIAWKLCKD